jgi:microcystin-dependent protein
MAEPTIRFYQRNIARSLELTGRQDIYTPVGNIAQVLTDLGLLTPVGGVIPFAGSAAPVGYILCDGSAISRSEYDELFQIIGTSYGIGDGSTTFNVPNLKGRVVIAKDASQTEFDVLGETGGSKTHTLTIAEMPSHDHNGLTQSAGTHTHTVTDPGHTHAITDPGHTHTQTTVNDDFNNSGSYPNFTKPSYAQYDSAGTITWTDTINSNTTGVSVNTNTTGITNQNAGAHQHGIDSQGGGSAHSILPPYLVMNYLIKY